MPRHTWTVRIELCETYDAVYAHAFLENGPGHLTGHGKANVGDITTVIASRGAAARRALADLSQAMLASQEPAGVHVPEPEPVQEPVPTGVYSLSLGATSLSRSSVVPAVAG